LYLKFFDIGHCSSVLIETKKLDILYGDNVNFSIFFHKRNDFEDLNYLTFYWWNIFNDGNIKIKNNEFEVICNKNGDLYGSN